jgi:hypothetical protein
MLKKKNFPGRVVQLAILATDGTAPNIICNFKEKPIKWIRQKIPLKNFVELYLGVNLPFLTE